MASIFGFANYLVLIFISWEIDRWTKKCNHLRHIYLKLSCNRWVANREGVI